MRRYPDVDSDIEGYTETIFTRFLCSVAIGI